MPRTAAIAGADLNLVAAAEEFAFAGHLALNRALYDDRLSGSNFVSMSLSQTLAIALADVADVEQLDMLNEGDGSLAVLRKATALRELSAALRSFDAECSFFEKREQQQ